MFNKSILFRIFVFIRPFSWNFILGLFGAFGGAALNTAIPALARRIVNNGLTSLDIAAVGIAQLLFIFLLQGVFSHELILASPLKEEFQTVWKLFY